MSKEIINEKKDWVSRFYLIELVLLLIGNILVYLGYRVNHLLFSIIGCTIVGFGLIMALLEKKKK